MENKNLEMLIIKDKWKLENLFSKFSKVSPFSTVKTAQNMNFTKDEFRAIYLQDEVYQAYLDKVSSIIADFVFKFWLNVYPECAKEILEKSKFDDLKVWVLETGYITDLDVYDKLTESKDLSVMFFALKRCSIDKIRELKTHPNHRVRRFVFQRLGPKECLDDMLDDKNRDIRAMGVKYAPYNYKKLSDMAMEKSKLVFVELVKKIDDDLLPILLGSKHIKDPKVEALLLKRMDGKLVIEPF